MEDLYFLHQKELVGVTSEFHYIQHLKQQSQVFQIVYLKNIQTTILHLIIQLGYFKTKLFEKCSKIRYKLLDQIQIKN